jgi:hypothetical protein
VSLTGFDAGNLDETIGEVIRGNDSDHETNDGEFWICVFSRVVGSRLFPIIDSNAIRDEDFARGFVEGALSLWEEVQSDL